MVGPSAPAPARACYRVRQGACVLTCMCDAALRNPVQVPDFKPEESVYKTRWMPPAKPVGAWS